MTTPHGRRPARTWAPPTADHTTPTPALCRPAGGDDPEGSTVTDRLTAAAAENVRAIAARHNPDPCGRTARVTKFGSPYLLVCQLRRHERRGLLCRDIDNGSSFEPDDAA